MPFVNTPHLHLLMNHVPTVGTLIGLGLLLLALMRRSDHLMRASLELFFLVALTSLPVYLTGLAAQEAISGLPDVSLPAIAAHHDGVLLAFVFVEVTGALAWLGLWQYRRLARLAGWVSPAILLLALVTVTLMAGAASVGGEIRHPEIVTDEAAVRQAGWITVEVVQDFVINKPWTWPAAEAVHFIGLSLLFGVLIVVNFRILGGLRAVSYASLHRLLPWAMLGFGLNLVTGMLFVVASPEQYMKSDPFYWKVACLMVAGADLLYLTVVERLWALQAGHAAVLLDKAIAVLALAAWVGVLYSGRMLPFLGNAF
jgi:uncharacterized membrane protein